MALSKIYERLNWENEPSLATPVDEVNLNHLDDGINQNDNRIVLLDTMKLDKTSAAQDIVDVDMLDESGVFVFKRRNGSTFTIDTKLERLPIDFDFDTVTQHLLITLDDGTVQEIDLSTVILETEFLDSDTISVNVNQHVVSMVVKAHSIGANELEIDYLANILVYTGTAETAAASARARALESEGYALGTQNGVPVSSDSPYHNNNAKYFKEEAEAIAGNELSGLSDVNISNPSNNDLLCYQNGTWENRDVLSSKADKVSNPTNGNFVGLDSTGNIADSGKKASDFAPTTHDHTVSDIEDFPSTMPPSAHNQSASTITDGTFAGDVSVPASTSYGSSLVRNSVFTSTDPGPNATVQYPNGTIIYVYE